MKLPRPMYSVPELKSLAFDYLGTTPLNGNGQAELYARLVEFLKWVEETT